MGIHQVAPWKVWPSGDSRPIAVLPFNSSELSKRYGLYWMDGIDDLGPYHLAAIELESGNQAWLVEHNDDPNPGTVVYVDAASDIAKSLLLLLKALGIKREMLLWEAPLQGIEPVARYG